MVVGGMSINDVRFREPVDKPGLYALTNTMLEEGTKAHTSEEIARLIEDTGGSMSVGTDRAVFQVLRPDAEKTIQLVFECLRQSTFPKEEFDSQKEQLLSTIAESESQPQQRASNAFRAMIYGDHPLGRPSYGKSEVIEKLTAAECKAFHESVCVPSEITLAIVGDFESAEMLKWLEAATAGWKSPEQQPLKLPTPPKITEFQTKIIVDPAASQTHVMLGQLGIRRTDPDYYKLIVMDNILGTGPGFTDRLSSNLRDRQGLAYTVNATITANADRQPGTFVGYIGTFPDKYFWVRDGFLKEIQKMREAEPTALEVEDAKK
ncbi:MAG: M16 family metallopeptidase, partial [Gemmataceae bacterium]